MDENCASEYTFFGKRKNRSNNYDTFLTEEKEES